MKIPSTERIRVAQELHDGIAQDLVGIGYSLDLLLSEESLSGKARRDIRTTRFAVDGLIAKVRAEILNLRKIDDYPLHIHLKKLAENLCAGIDMELNLDEVAASPEMQMEWIAIATEILRNCLSHSRATHIGIKLYSIDNRTCLEVIDNGVGGAKVQDGHFGLPGISERVMNLGGSMTITSIKGTHIAILI